MDAQSKPLVLDHDEKGIARLLALILAAEGRVGAVVLEATGGFEREVALTLCRAGLAVRGAIPARRATLPRRGSFDALDARILSHFAQT